MDFLKSNTIKIFIIIIAISVVGIIAFSLLSRAGGNGTADERALSRAAEKYFNARPTILPKNNYESATVTANTLVNTGYIKQSKDQTCYSYVTVVKSSNEYIYNPYIKCNNENDTKFLSDKISSSVTTLNDGVYKINDGYVYKGENPNNFVKFSDELWRIIKMDKDNIIKIFYDGDSSGSNVWDDRYNLETEDNDGINDYKVSRVFSYLIDYLNDDETFTNADRAKLTTVDLCIGKRKTDDITTDGSAECSIKFEKQMIGLLQANEYFNASNDANCSASSQQVCQNYNFLAESSYWTMTGVSNNTVEAFRVSPSIGLDPTETADSDDIYPVLYLRNDTVITGGTGTKEDPYVIR